LPPVEPTDIVARVIAERFTSSLGQRVIVENAPARPEPPA
jgi:tripartite-type tricarboxylate transporter receptor subunit TctC